MRLHNYCNTCICVKPSSYRKFEYERRDSYKFWRIKRVASTVYTVYGRIGTAGSKLVKDFWNDWEARQYMEEKIEEKLNKGYYSVR